MVRGSGYWSSAELVRVRSAISSMDVGALLQAAPG